MESCLKNKNGGRGGEDEKDDKEESRGGGGRGFCKGSTFEPTVVKASV